jgi:hypothetical protein
MPTSSGFQINEVLTAANTNTYLLRAGRNCLINGAMNVTQRATSQAGISAGDTYNTADRWFIGLNAAGVWTQTTQALTSSDAPLTEGIRNSTKVTCTTATGGLGAGAYAIWGQKIEGINFQQFAKGTSGAKFFALSFWVRSNAVGTYIAELVDHANSRTCSASYTISVSNTWQKVRLVFPSDATGLVPNTNAWCMSMFMWLAAGSNYSGGSPLQTSWASDGITRRATGQVNVGVAVNNFFEVTGVQLEPNAVCTPFENEDIQVTLSKCQRYYYKMTGYGGDDALCQGNYYGTTQLWCVIQHPVEMRGAPSFGLASGVYNAYAIGLGNPVASAVQYSGTPKTSTIYFNTANARTQGVGGWIATAAGFFTISAEI